MLSSVVNSRHYRRRPIHPLQLHRRGVEPVTASPIKSAFTNCQPRNLFKISSYVKWRMSPSPHKKNRISYSRSASTVRALCSLFSLFATRVFHNSFVHKRFRTLSQKCRGVPLPFSIWNQPTPSSYVLPARLGHQLRVTIHLLRLTPSASADSINLHPADRYFRRQSQPRGGGIP
jgi:hypothetical protein